MANHFNSDVTFMHIFEIAVTWYGAGEGPLINAECFQQFATDAKRRLADYPIQLPSSRYFVYARANFTACSHRPCDFRISLTTSLAALCRQAGASCSGKRLSVRALRWLHKYPTLPASPTEYPANHLQKIGTFDGPKF
ncbi:MAG: hypothetical protein WB992_06410 [Bryobacteraceae bacterium]